MPTAPASLSGPTSARRVTLAPGANEVCLYELDNRDAIATAPVTSTNGPLGNGVNAFDMATTTVSMIPSIARSYRTAMPRTSLDEPRVQIG